MKLSKIQKAELAKTKKFIERLSKNQDYYYDYWKVILGIEDEDGYLNDYLFNSGSMKALEEKLRKES